MAGRYKPYPQYKDSGVELLGAIPEHWAISKLRFISSFGRGLGITKANLQDTGIPCVSYGEVHSRYGFEVDPSVHNLHCVDESYLLTDPRALLEKGDFVFADTSEDVEGSGNFTQLVSNKTLFAGYHTVVVRPVAAHYFRFLAYMFDSIEYRTQIRNSIKGVKVFSITQAILKNTNIWLPNYEEQESIADFLDYETAKIDTLIAKQEQLIELLKEKRQAVISHAVTKGLNPDAPMKNSGVEWLGQVPEHWNVAALKRFIHKMEQGRSPECESTPASTEQWGVLKTSCVNNAVFNVNENKALPEHIEPHYQYEVKAGDVLMSRASGSIKLIGSVARVQNDVRDKILLSDKVFRIVLTRNMDTEFFVLLMASDYLRTLIENAISGADGMANNITKSSIISFVIPVPSIDEQQSIVQKTNLEQEVFAKLNTSAIKALELLRERKTALISAAVTGKIDVRHPVCHPSGDLQSSKSTIHGDL